MKTLNKTSGRAIARRWQTIAVALCGLMAALYREKQVKPRQWQCPGWAAAGLVLMLALTIASTAKAALIVNGDFETDLVSDVPEGAQNTITAWVINPSGSYFLYDPTGSIRFPSDPNYAGENNAAVVYLTDGSVRQTLGITLTNNARYTLTLDVGNEAGQSFPTLIDGVTGDARTRLLVNGASSAMPGFQSSTASVPTDGTFQTWTLVWQTGASEPLFGDDITVDLSKGATGGNLWFDNVSLTVEAVPEPSAVALLGLGGLLLMRRRVRAKASSVQIA